MLDNHSARSLKLFKEKCNENSLKITPQRLAIYQELSKSTDHPSCDDIYNRIKNIFPHISFDTVYRSLMTFSQIGIIKLVEGYGEKKRFDTLAENHHHLRCIKCGTIVDFYNKKYDDISIPKKFKKQFKILSKKVVLEGLCKECQT